MTTERHGLPATILIVEDERLVRESMAAFLGMHYRILAVGTAAEALEAASSRRPDLVILDIGLPDGDGLEVCRTLRSRGFEAPILFLTSRDQEVDELLGFSVGGDDYMVKPISLPLLQARIHAATRRGRRGAQETGQIVSWGSVKVDFSTRRAEVAGDEVILSAKEAELLQYLVQHRGAVVTREALLANVWRYDADVSSRTVDTHVLNLRKKLHDGEDGLPVLKTVRGVGYTFTV